MNVVNICLVHNDETVVRKWCIIMSNEVLFSPSDHDVCRLLTAVVLPLVRLLACTRFFVESVVFALLLLHVFRPVHLSACSSCAVAVGEIR